LKFPAEPFYEMRVIVNQADSLEESPASPSFISNRTGTGNNENPVAKQESNEIRRMEDFAKSLDLSRLELDATPLGFGQTP
jgi:hypothetical protein